MYILIYIPLNILLWAKLVSTDNLKNRNQNKLTVKLIMMFKY